MRRLPLVVSAAVCLVAGAASAITFNDGGVHVIDAAASYPFDSVIIQDSPTAQPTTVYLAVGGEVGTASLGSVYVYNTSVFQMLGGTVGDVIRSYDDSEVVVTAVQPDDIIAEGQSTVSLIGGSINSVTTNESAQLYITSGSVANVTAYQDSRINVSGGAIGGVLEAFQNARVEILAGEASGAFLLIRDSASLVVNGGTISSQILVYDSASLEIHSGSLYAEVHSFQTATVRILGGEFTSSLFARNFSSVSIPGRNFNLPFGPVAATSGSLLGMFADGTPLNLPFVRDSTATITLEALMLLVPALAPLSIGMASILLAALGVLSLNGASQRRSGVNRCSERS